MEIHITKFNEIKSLLRDKLGDDVITYQENGTEFIEINKSKFWLTVDDKEFTVGYGLNHTHFSENYGNLTEGIIQVFDLLTNKIRTTDYVKGNMIYKTILEIEYPNSKIINIGEIGILLFPFWKKTKIETSFSEPILHKKEIENEVNKIIN